MSRIDAPGERIEKIIEPKHGEDGPHKRLLRLERLVAAIEDELADDELSDEQKLQNIGERIASALDGR